MLPKVRSRAGNPTASDFSSADGSPLVQNNETGEWWAYSNNTVGPIGSTTLRGSGAKGDGVTDDTDAIETALATGKNVIGTPGDTYLIDGGLSVAAVNQRLDLTGCIVKLKNSATVKGMVTLSAVGASVIGGKFDGNKANNASGDQFSHFAVNLAAEGTSVDRAWSVDSYGIGFRGNAASKLTISRCRVDTPDLYGIYVEGSNLADFYDIKIIDNIIDYSTVSTVSVGLLLTGMNSPFTYEQRRWRVSGNIVKGPTTGTSVGLSVRGYDGIVQGNQVYGSQLQISIDIAQRCVIEGNRCESPSTDGTSYGIEVNGAFNVVSNNYIKGSDFGVIASGPQDLGKNLIANNVIEEPVVAGIKLQAGAAGAQYNSVIGNTIVAPVTAITGVYLANDCKYALIQGNHLVGPGSGVANSRGVYLDTVNSDVAVIANRFESWERPVGLYNAAAVAQARVTFLANDCTRDMPADVFWLNLEGSATFGTGLVQMGNAPASREYRDRANNVLTLSGTGTPEGAVMAGIGSLYMRTDGGAATSLYVKESGTGNTGWVGK